MEKDIQNKDVNLCFLWQDLNSIFLGLKLSNIQDGFKDIFPILEGLKGNNLEIKEVWKDYLEKRFYYILKKEDNELNKKFRCNLSLCRDRMDEDYLEFLKLFLIEVNPKTLEEINLLDPKLDINSITIKPRPKIIAKPRIKPTILKKSKNRESFPAKYSPKYYIPSNELKAFLIREWDLKEDQSNGLNVTLSNIKETLNKYICDKNLQDLNTRRNIHLNLELEILFKKERGGRSIITYVDLKQFVSLHLKPLIVPVE